MIKLIKQYIEKKRNSKNAFWKIVVLTKDFGNSILEYQKNRNSNEENYRKKHIKFVNEHKKNPLHKIPKLEFLGKVLKTKDEWLNSVLNVKSLSIPLFAELPPPKDVSKKIGTTWLPCL